MSDLFEMCAEYTKHNVNQHKMIGTIQMQKISKENLSN